MLDFDGKRVLVLGLGETGLSMTRWLARHGARVSVADTRPQPPHADALRAELPDVPIATGEFHESDFGHADAIAISPGVDRRAAHVAAAIDRGVPVIGDIEIFARSLERLVESRARLKPKIIAITGSNGKSTVTSMSGAAARAAGLNTIVAGNIGLPVLDVLTGIENGEPLPEVFALELSSFQLESTQSLRADAATVLNVTEDHLDRYDGMPEYAAAKARIFAGTGAQVLNRQDALSMGMTRPGRKVVTFGADCPSNESDWGIHDRNTLARGSEPLMRLEELKVAGLHNAANALAALALCSEIGVPVEPMLEGLRTFEGLPHRLEKVAELNGVGFYDDSKGTNVGATVAALNGMTVPVALIAGGDGKGQDFTPLVEAVRAHARAVVLIGRDGPQIERALAGSGVRLLKARTMEDAVQSAYSECRAGDAVLLSPACASYDMFRSYVHRGQVFVGAVKALIDSQQGQTR
jgi:UDP-N-acetylmuramoylalanine--D-glutamate ligase